MEGLPLGFLNENCCVMKHAAFLFGSGISFASGAPTVGEITKGLLERAWKPHTDSRLMPCTENDGADSLGVAKLAQNFIRILKQQIDPHLLARDGREGNYEDIYSAVMQIW
jgi:hypothetical protein